MSENKVSRFQLYAQLKSRKSASSSIWSKCEIQAKRTKELIQMIDNEFRN